MNKKIRCVVLFLTFLIGIPSCRAQVSLIEISLKEQIVNSSLVVEGEVVSQKSFWDAEHKYIYTAYTVEVYKVFKGEPKESIEILAIGGSIGLDALVASHSLNLHSGSMGVFTLHESNIKLEAKVKAKQYRVYSGIQGFYEYDVDNNSAQNLFKIRKGIKSSLYNEIAEVTQQQYKDVALFDVDQAKEGNANGASQKPPSGITFSAAPLSAGTNTELVITGSGFGSAKGKVGFRDADNGGRIFRDALDSEVVSWTNNEIRVLVPFFAGNGNIRITDAAGSSANSSDGLTVTYAIQNAIFNLSTGQRALGGQHYNDNNLGGNTWKLQTDFFNDDVQAGSRASFERALETWRCETGVNWLVDDVPTTVTDGNTADHTVRFDVGNELPASTLGICLTRYGAVSCANGLISYVTDYDIIFDNERDWFFNAPGETFDRGEYDFETVALHELGHAHLLGHVIDPSNIMDFQVRQSVSNIILDDKSIAGANSVHLKSTTNQICRSDLPLMTDYAGSCVSLGVENNILETGVSMFPNPANKKITIKSGILNLDKVEIFDISGRIIRSKQVLLSSRIVEFDLSDTSNGVYFVNIHSGSSYITKKLVVN